MWQKPFPPTQTDSRPHRYKEYQSWKRSYGPSGQPRALCRIPPHPCCLLHSALLSPLHTGCLCVSVFCTKPWHLQTVSYVSIFVFYFSTPKHSQDFLPCVNGGVYDRVSEKNEWMDSCVHWSYTWMLPVMGRSLPWDGKDSLFNNWNDRRYFWTRNRNLFLWHFHPVVQFCQIFSLGIYEVLRSMPPKKCV